MAPAKITSVPRALETLEALADRGPIADALVNRLSLEGQPKLTRHTNLVIDEYTDAVVTALANDPDLHLDRSKALRRILEEGMKALLVQEANRA